MFWKIDEVSYAADGRLLHTLAGTAANVHDLQTSRTQRMNSGLNDKLDRSEPADETARVSPSAEVSRQFNFQHFSSCQNVASGPVVIVASGASARSFPLASFAHIPAIAMNGAISMFDDISLAPYFYVSSDPNFAIEQPGLFGLALQHSQNLALGFEHLQHVPPDIQVSGSLYLLHQARKQSRLKSLLRADPEQVRLSSLWNRRSRSIGFSKNMAKGHFDARTVAYVALQLAYHLGFEQVFLVGFDLNAGGGRFYESGQGYISPCSLDVNFQSRILPSLRLMANGVVGDNFRVFNLSSTSRVPSSIIPKIDVDQALRMIGC